VESKVGIEVFGRLEGVHFETRSERCDGRGYLPEIRSYSGDVFQLEEEMQLLAVAGDAPAEAA
jgi:hypothetical protein